MKVLKPFSTAGMIFLRHVAADDADSKTKPEPASSGSMV